MVSDNIKKILGLSDKEYILRLDNIKKQVKGKNLTLEVMREIDAEFAAAYKSFLSRQNANKGSADALLRSDNWWNEVLVSEFDVCAIYANDLDLLPEEYLIKAQEENLPIVIVQAKSQIK